MFEVALLLCREKKVKLNEKVIAITKSVCLAQETAKLRPSVSIAQD